MTRNRLLFYDPSFYSKLDAHTQKDRHRLTSYDCCRSRPGPHPARPCDNFFSYTRRYARLRTFQETLATGFPDFSAVGLIPPGEVFGKSIVRADRTDLRSRPRLFSLSLKNLTFTKKDINTAGANSWFAQTFALDRHKNISKSTRVKFDENKKSVARDLTHMLYFLDTRDLSLPKKIFWRFFCRLSQTPRLFHRTLFR